MPRSERVQEVGLSKTSLICILGGWGVCTAPALGVAGLGLASAWVLEGSGVTGGGVWEHSCHCPKSLGSIGSVMLDEPRSGTSSISVA